MYSDYVSVALCLFGMSVATVLTHFPAACFHFFFFNSTSKSTLDHKCSIVLFQNYENQIHNSIDSTPVWGEVIT